MVPVERRVVVTDPDPTAAVEAAVKLAIKNLDDKTADHFKAIENVADLSRDQFKEKLDALVNGINDKFVANEKLANQQAAANKDLVDQLARANSVALQAALLTQEKSAAKFELSVGDQLKQLQVNFDSANKATNEKIDRLTSRLDLGQGGFQTGGDVRREDREMRRDAGIATTNTWGIVISIIGVLIAASAVISAVLLSRK